MKSVGISVCHPSDSQQKRSMEPAGTGLNRLVSLCDMSSIESHPEKYPPTLVIDLDTASFEEIKEALTEAADELSSFDDEAAVTIILGDHDYDRRLLAMLNQIYADHSDVLGAIAVVDPAGMMTRVIRLVRQYTGEAIEGFDTRQEADAWLEEQDI